MFPQKASDKRKHLPSQTYSQGYIEIPYSCYREPYQPLLHQQGISKIIEKCQGDEGSKHSIRSPSFDDDSKIPSQEVHQYGKHEDMMQHEPLKTAEVRPAFHFNLFNGFQLL
jgi:hypothetical protein